MRVLAISQSELTSGLAKLADSYKLFGPVKERDQVNFAPLKKGQAPELSFSNTRLSAKGVVYPQSEKMFRANLDPAKEDHHVYKDEAKDYSPRALVGVRPCDAKALMLVNLNFDNPSYQDPYWVNSYAALTQVGLACTNPCPSCFCTSTGSGPHDTRGLDVLLVPADGGYLARVLTEKGEKLAAAAGWAKEAEEGVEDKLAALAKEAESKVTATITTDKLASKVTLPLYEAPFWEDVSFSCINCGTCTFLCPTCWCFDIQDETCGTECVRYKNWDSCMFPLFTIHGSGHNPRGTKLHRVRQRFLHKLKYFLDKYDQGIMCVGCGRCIRQCPVNIDIRRVAGLMNEYQTAEKCEI
ncbi:MAG: 4Fe-4S dicluster domain-containing protein [Thermodesulfobacteriota bacterium]